MVRVSVIMAVYDTCPVYLHRALKSVLNQSIEDFEVIVVEDPSSRDAGEVVRAFGDPRVQYIKNLGRTSLVRQKNYGISLSRAPLIAIMDSDDECHERRLESQMAVLDDQSNIAVVGSCIDVIDSESRIIGKRTYPASHDAIAKAMRSYVPMCHPTIMMRRDALTAVGGYRDIGFPIEDYDLWSRLLLSGYRFANIAERLLKYRLHSQQIKATRTLECVAGVLAVKRAVWLRKMSSSERLRYLAEHSLLAIPDWCALWLINRLLYR